MPKNTPPLQNKNQKKKNANHEQKSYQSAKPPLPHLEGVQMLCPEQMLTTKSQNLFRTFGKDLNGSRGGGWHLFQNLKLSVRDAKLKLILTLRNSCPHSSWAAQDGAGLKEFQCSSVLKEFCSSVQKEFCCCKPSPVACSFSEVWWMWWPWWHQVAIISFKVLSNPKSVFLWWRCCKGWGFLLPVCS